MKLKSKKLLALLMAVFMLTALLVPAMADDPEIPASSTDGKVMITKTLRIAQGITVPDTTFTFTFVQTPSNKTDSLPNKQYLVNSALSQQGNLPYPTLDPVTISYNSDSRTAIGTDTELTFITNAIDLNQVNWPDGGMYAYNVSETEGSLSGMEYDKEVYYLEVFVNNDANKTINTIAVYRFDETTQEYVKVNAAYSDREEYGHSDEKDGCDDYAGNGFLFTNTYRKMVTKHPINENTTSEDTPLDGDTQYSDYAFKLTKDVSGNMSNSQDKFDFHLTVQLPATYEIDPDRPLTAKVNGYSAKENYPSDPVFANIQPADYAVPVEMPLPASHEGGTEFPIYLAHGDSFSIPKLPAGTLITVEEDAFPDRPYAPSYVGKWGIGALTSRFTGSEAASTGLKSSVIVVGEDGAFIQYTNTMEDVTPTGIVINNLPYILMVVIALGGIGFFMLSKKRRAR